MKSLFMKRILRVFSAAFLAVNLPAGSRSSANYSVPADTTDAGGQRAASAAYTHDGSIGGIGGISTAVPKVARHGYVGQLYEIAGLGLGANPLTIPETGTRQLSAAATADDGTHVAVSASSVSWSVVNGPISSIDASGLATAGNVYQNTAATVGGSLGAYNGTLGLTVVNVGGDDYLSYAGDGINDAWQVQYFGEENLLARPERDPDGDLQDNYFEYYANTEPTNAASKFSLSIANVPGQPAQKDVIFSPRFPSRIYDVHYRDNLAAALWGPLFGSLTNDAATVRTVRDLNATGNQKYYRVRISIP